MRKIQFLGVLALAFAPFAVSAQQNMPGSINQSPIHSGGQVQLKKAVNNTVVGTVYLNERPMGANINGSNDLILVRYNAFNDNFEKVDQATGETTSMPRTAASRIKFVSDRKEYVVVNYLSKKKQATTGYLNILSENPALTIYKKESVALIPAREAENSYAQSKPATYKRAKDEFYITVGDAKSAVPLPDNKKDFAKLFPAKEKEILAYIKDNKIDLEKESDLLKIGTYLPTIL